MGLVFNSVEAYSAALDKAVDACFKGRLIGLVKHEIQEAVSPVILGYEPEFYSRRMLDGGLLDTANMDDSYGGKTLEVEMVADWQNIGFKMIDGRGTYDDLSDVIENSGMYGRPATPYVQIAEDAVVKMLEAELPAALISKGF